MQVSAQKEVAFDSPKLKLFLPEAGATGRAVLILPGGGYAGLASDNEGYGWVDYFTGKGIAAAVLEYTLPEGNRSLPFDDVEKAMKLLRSHAEEWHIDTAQIGIMGSSAGGHLASTLATHAPLRSRPDFQILFYPVISMDADRTHAGSVTNFLGDKRHDRRYVEMYSNELQVRRNATPPALILLSTDDTLVPPVTNGVAYYSALRDAGIPAAMYAYAEGEHGFGSQTSFIYHEQLLQDIASWLDNLKTPRRDAVRVACIGTGITAGQGLDMSGTYGYTARLKRILGDGYNVRNFGAAGSTMLSEGDRAYINEPEWSEVMDFRPDIVVMELGTNDSKPANRGRIAALETDLRRMTASLKALDTKPEICLALPMKAWDNSEGISDSVITETIIPLMRRVAKKEKLRVTDLHTLFGSDRSLMQDDGIHPGRKGAEVMAGIVAEEIKRMKEDGKER